MEEMEGMTMRVTVRDMNGQQVGERDLSEAVFAAPINTSVMHQALLRQLSNARQGTHDTKGRSEVSGGGKKPWRQKGTGRARQGSTRAPNFIGGGTVFGPTPRKYTKALPKKMQRQALRSALSAKAQAGAIVVIDKITIDAPKTKTMVKMLSALGVGEKSALLVLPEKTLPVWKSASNVPTVKTLLSGYINVRDLLSHDTVVLTQDAVDYIEIWLGADVVEEVVEEVIEEEVELVASAAAAEEVEVAADAANAPEGESADDTAGAETEAEA
jgi:large subunit ribosomal protein L4